MNSNIFHVYLSHSILVQIIRMYTIDRKCAFSGGTRIPVYRYILDDTQKGKPAKTPAGACVGDHTHPRGGQNIYRYVKKETHKEDDEMGR